MSTEYLCRLLKRETGNGFCFHLHGVRVREAQRLLRDTQLSAKEIAYHTGYATTSRLDHHFKRVCGTLPIEFRRTRDNERQLSDTEIKNAGSLVVPKGSVEPMITQ
jgi:AraC-like DNA-binding protein